MNFALFSAAGLLKAIQGLVPVKKQVTRGGKTFSQTFYVRSGAARRKGEEHFNNAMSALYGDVITDVLRSEGIGDYSELVDRIKTGAQDTAHKLYQKMLAALRKEPDRGRREINPITGKDYDADKGVAAHLIGTTLVLLKKTFSEAPKAAAKIKVTSKKGKEYYKYKESEELPLLKPSAIAKAKRKMGGWPVTGALESKHVRAMLKTKAAKLVSGKIDAKRKWHLPKKASDMQLKYKGDHLLIRVKQVRKVEKRTRATAKVEIKIPYEFAKAFLQTQIASKRTANNFIFRMENSEGYREFLRRAAA